MTRDINAQVASGGKVPTKPGSYNRSSISKALEHLTGLANLQPSHKPPKTNATDGQDTNNRLQKTLLTLNTHVYLLRCILFINYSVKNRLFLIVREWR